MCDFITPMIAALGIGSTTAAGATAAAATTAAGTAAATTASAAAPALTIGSIGSVLSGVGAAVSIAGSLYQGRMAQEAAELQADLIGKQQETEAKLNAVKDHRARARFQSEIRKQTAEIAASGVSLDSPTAIALGQTAAAEMAFNSQSIRTTGQARQTELSSSRRAALARGRTSMLNGGFSAAGAFFDAAPDIWPGLAA